MFGQNIERAVHEAIELRQQLRAMPIRDIHDVEAMAHLDADARHRLEVPERIADAFIGEVFASGSNGAGLERALTSLTVQAGQAIDGDRDVLASMRRRSVAALSADLPSDKPARRPFHWPLEFPEVFSREGDGFDGMVGNPPFLGGKRITGVAGTAFRDWLVSHIADGRRGSADLVAYFFLRAWSLIRNEGGFGLLAVNTIAEGDTRQVGLEAMVGAGAVIHAAYPNEPWPGKAAVVTSRVHVHKGKWRGDRSILGRSVLVISAYLSDREEWSPMRLRASENITLQASVVVGGGFVLEEEDAKLLLNADAKNADVIFPYVNGDDLNSDPRQRPSRWVVNFWDWPEERARKYKEPWAWIEKRVKPERQRRDEKGNFVLRRPLPERWWQYGDKRPALYHAIGRGHAFEQHPEGWRSDAKPLPEVLATSFVGKHFGPSVVPNNTVFSHACAVFAVSRPHAFAALLNSSIGQAWVWQQSSRHESRLRFAPSDAIETMPFPKELDALGPFGEAYLKARRKVMGDEGIGLTKLYNRFHADTERDPRIEGLRALQREVDAAVACAYGWDDLALEHDFHEVPYLPENDRVRFTISETARVEVLQRLSALNRQRYEEEIARGLHSDATPRASARAPRAGRATSAATAQPLLDLEDGAATTVYGTAPDRATLSFLSAHAGWHAKADILAATGITDGQWNTLIADLIAGGRIERQGEKRGARYRIRPGVTL